MADRMLDVGSPSRAWWLDKDGAAPSVYGLVN